MRLSITRAISEIGREKFHNMMLAGAFPKVKYEQSKNVRGFTWETYSMMDYSVTWAKFMKVADIQIKEKTGDPLGVFTRKHSAQFLATIKGIVNNIAEADVFAQEERFQTMWD